MLYPTNESETAVDASLASLRELVGEEPPATVVAGAVTGVLGRWRRLDRDSPYRRDALTETRALVDTYCASEPDRARRLLPERERLASALARQELADRLRQARSELGLSVRRTAERAGVAPSYLSELEGARTGLPRAAVAERLDSALESNVSELVSGARTSINRLREERLSPLGRAPRPETDPRLVEAMATLRNDASLLDLLENARRLDTTERRAVLALMRELGS